MSAAAQFRTEHVAEAPRGWRVRTVVPGSGSRHEVRIAFPPGRRKHGSGKVIEILHPKDEASNPACSISRQNPSELLIFGNPAAHRGVGNPADVYERAKSQFRSARAAWEEIGKSTGLKPSDVKAGPHTATMWVFRKKANRRTQNAGHKKNCRCFACKHQRAHARGGKVQRLNPRRRRRKDRKNPSETEQAVQLFETFHGRDASKIIEKHVSAATRKDYTALGHLGYLVTCTPLGQPATYYFEGDGVMLAVSPDGKQLYCIGGRQNLLPLLDEESQEKDFIDLGECLEVMYEARKWQNDYEPTDWYHKFGEETGVRPQLMFDKLKKQIFFIGGEYFIDSNVDLSPGIEN